MKFKKIWAVVFILTLALIFLVPLVFATTPTPPGNIIGNLVIQQQPVSSNPAIAADLITNNVSIIIILAVATIFFTTVLFARHLRRSRNYLLPFSPGLNKRAQLSF